MPDYIKTINAGGGADYTSCVDAWNDWVGTLVSGDTFTFVLEGAGNVGGCNMQFESAIPAGVAVFVTAETDWEGQELDAALPESRFWTLFGNAASTSITFRGVQVADLFANNHAGGFFVERCHARQVDRSGAIIMIGTGTFEVVNSAVTSADDAGIAVFGTGTVATIDHVVVRGTPYRGIYSTDSANAVVTNTIVDGATFLDFEPDGGTFTGSSHNLSSDSSAPGTGSITGASVLLQSGTYLLDPGDTTGAKDGGVATSTTHDVLGVAYPPVDPSMGINQATLESITASLEEEAPGADDEISAEMTTVASLIEEAPGAVDEILGGVTITASFVEYAPGADDSIQVENGDDMAKYVILQDYQSAARSLSAGNAVEATGDEATAMRGEGVLLIEVPSEQEAAVLRSLDYARSARTNQGAAATSGATVAALVSAGLLSPTPSVDYTSALFGDLPVFEDEAEAEAGDLTAGQLYRTAAGAVRVKL